MAQAVQKRVKPKFRGNTKLASKVVTHFPDNLAREYERINRQYMALLNSTLKEYMPIIRKAMDDERAGMRRDDDNTVMGVIASTFLKIAEVFEKKATAFGIKRRLENLSNLTRKLSIREWKRVVHKTLGINILEDYYMGEFFREQIKVWVNNNVSLIKTIPQDTLTTMRNIIEDGYLSGKTNTAIGDAIQEAYRIERERAQFIARDQIAKLNSDITEAQQRDAGVEEYEWSDSGDSRVRHCHAEFDGQRFKYSDPPMNWYDTKSKGRVYTKPYNPGKAPRCRCVALPVFDIDTLNLPWTEGDVSITDFKITVSGPDMTEPRVLT